MRPFLSVVTINRNDAKGLRKTIESVLSHPYLDKEDLEYIVIDGASDDGSVDVIKEYAAREDFRHKISYFVSEPDTGIYNAMNKGIKVAHGEYVQILNSGDTYTPDALYGIKEMARKHEGAILYGVINFVHEGKFQFVFGKYSDILPLQNIPHAAAFVPMSVYDKFGLYEESFRVLADYDLFCTFKLGGVPFFYTSKIIADFDDTGISTRGGLLNMQEANRVAERHGIPPIYPAIIPRAATGEYRTRRHTPFIKRAIKAVLPHGVIVIVRRIKKKGQRHK